VEGKMIITTPAMKDYEILLIEDCWADVLLMKMAFQKCKFGANLNILSDGEKALAFLKHEPPYQKAAKPDLVLLDLNMPRMDGRVFLRRVKALPKLAKLKLIVISGSKLESDIREVMDMNVKAFLEKPMDLYGFFRLVESLKKYLVIDPK
jgi:CheY-like chemotaxis protein